MRIGWDQRSYVYRPEGSVKDCFDHTLREYRLWLAPLQRELEAGARVLELGCGTGVPASRELAASFDVTGIDLSDVVIRRARREVPTAHFTRADMTRVRFAPGRFGGVVSLHAIIHVPLSKQHRLLERIYSWLRPGGLFLAIVGHDAWEGTERGWLGVDAPMFWSHADAATYRSWMIDIGFEIRLQQYVPEWAGGHEFFFACKPPTRQHVV